MTEIDDVTDKQSALNKAGERRQEASFEHFRELTRYYEGLALYSGAAISLSVTFVGYLISDKTVHIATVVSHGVPIIWFLFASWILFAISFACSMLVKKEQSANQYAFFTADYSEKYQDYLSAQVRLLEANPPNIIYQGGTRDEKLTMAKTNLATITPIHQNNEKISKRYQFLLKCLRNIADLTALLGLISLITFAIVVIHHLSSRQ